MSGCWYEEMCVFKCVDKRESHSLFYQCELSFYTLFDFFFRLLIMIVKGSRTKPSSLSLDMSEKGLHNLIAVVSK